MIAVSKHRGIELVKVVRANVTIDWTVKQGARAKIRVLVKRILRHYGSRQICRMEQPI
jgi:hypothetical protein